MVSGAAAELDGELQAVLENLTEGMFPLAGWIADKTKGGYRPRGPVPWRDGDPPLTPKVIRVIAYFQELLGHSTQEAPVAARFADAIADPLRFHPQPNTVAAWRQSRGLDAKPQFGIVASQNVLATADGKPATRAQFYAPYWDLLRQTVRGADPKTPADWETLARDLLADTAAHWPGGQPLKSSPLIKQLGRDVLHGLLNMRNPAPDPWRVAFLEELGEHRRVGNSFTRDDVRRLVRAFKEKISAAG